MSTFRFPFEGSKQTYSQVGQDLFVLSMLKGKRNGIYLEIGAGPSAETSNTILLEREYGWRGVSVEHDENFYNDHKQNRRHHIELADATQINYTDLLHRGQIYTNIIDYASVDIDAEGTLIALMNLPFDTHKFAVITFEHDSYVYGPSYKNRSRDFLWSKGYVLVGGGIMPPNVQADYEDWWVHPELVDSSYIDQLTQYTSALKDWRSVVYV